MMKLLRIEVNKVVPYRIFWILTGLYFFFLAAGIIMAGSIFNHMVTDMNRKLPIPVPHINMYFFPDIWQNLTYFASMRYVLILPAIVIMILITNEFTFKTIRQNTVTGMSRNEFLISKLQIIGILSFIITIFVALGILILGILNSDQAGMALLWHKFSFIPGFFVQVLCFMIYAFFLGFLLRNTGLSIAIFVLYALIVEPILSGLTKIPSLKLDGLGHYLPVNAVTDVVAWPSIPVLKKIMGFNVQDYVSLMDCAVPLLYAAIMVGIVFFVMKRKDL